MLLHVLALILFVTTLFSPFPWFRQSAPDTLIAFSSNHGTTNIYTMKPDGSDLRQLTTSPYDYQAVWSPDGTRIAFTSRRDENEEIYVMNADGSDQVNLTNHPAKDCEPGWSPDGTQLVFVSTRDGNAEIYTMNADGGNIQRLTDYSQPASQEANMPSEGTPNWSPDGTQIAFYSRRDGNHEIYVMNSDGSNVRRLTNHAALDWDPVWSPDGTQIAFQSARDGNDEIFVMNADGTEQRNLSNNGQYDFSPSWSPDGQRLVFQSNRDGHYEIYVMNADGSDVRRVTDTAMSIAPDWQPAPDSAALAASDSAASDAGANMEYANAFFDDFSTDLGWGDQTGGTFYRDPDRKWLVWQADRSLAQYYYYPLGIQTQHVTFGVGIQATEWANNCNLYFGLSDGGIWANDSDWPSGVFVTMGWFGGGVGNFIAPHILSQSTSDVVAWNSEDPSTYLPYELNYWYYITMTIDSGSWTLRLEDTYTGKEIGTLSGTLPADFPAFADFVIFSPYDGDWPTGSGAIEFVVVEWQD